MNIEDRVSVIERFIYDASEPLSGLLLLRLSESQLLTASASSHAYKDASRQISKQRDVPLPRRQPAHFVESEWKSQSHDCHLEPRLLFLFQFVIVLLFFGKSSSAILAGEKVKKD